MSCSRAVASLRDLLPRVGHRSQSSTEEVPSTCRPAARLKYRSSSLALLRLSTSIRHLSTREHPCLGDYVPPTPTMPIQSGHPYRANAE